MLYEKYRDAFVNLIGIATKELLDLNEITDEKVEELKLFCKENLSGKRYDYEKFSELASEAEKILRRYNTDGYLFAGKSRRSLEFFGKFFSLSILLEVWEEIIQRYNSVIDGKGPFSSFEYDFERRVIRHSERPNFPKRSVFVIIRISEKVAGLVPLPGIPIDEDYISEVKKYFEMPEYRKGIAAHYQDVKITRIALVRIDSWKPIEKGQLIWGPIKKFIPDLSRITSRRFASKGTEVVLGQVPEEIQAMSDSLRSNPRVNLASKRDILNEFTEATGRSCEMPFIQDVEEYSYADFKPEGMDYNFGIIFPGLQRNAEIGACFNISKNTYVVKCIEPAIFKIEKGQKIFIKHGKVAFLNRSRVISGRDISGVLIRAYDEYFSTGDGHFNPTGFKKYLDKHGLNHWNIFPGDAFGNERILGVSSQENIFFLVPSFQSSNRAVADWFEDKSDGEVSGRVKSFSPTIAIYDSHGNMEIIRYGFTR